MNHPIEDATAFQKCEIGWKRPLIEIDENYVDDIKLARKMEVSTIESPEKPGRDWLFGSQGIDGRRSISTCEDRSMTPYPLYIRVKLLL